MRLSAGKSSDAWRVIDDSLLSCALMRRDVWFLERRIGSTILLLSRTGSRQNFISWISDAVYTYGRLQDHTHTHTYTLTLEQPTRCNAQRERAMS